MSENPYESPQSSIGSDLPRGRLLKPIAFMLMMILLAFPTSLFATMAVYAIVFAAIAASGGVGYQQAAEKIAMVAGAIVGFAVLSLMIWRGVYPIVELKMAPAPPEQDE